MVNTNQLAEIANAMGEPARAAMLHALMDGRALTATELAGVAGVTPSTASSHLAILSGAQLLKMSKQGRHRYHSLASAEVAAVLESMMSLATGRPLAVKRVSPGPRDAAMRAARSCYDHLAGKLGVAITDQLVARGVVVFGEEAGALTEGGARFLAAAGIKLAGGSRAGRPLCRPCLDWSERRPHLAGQLGAAICAHCLDAGWLRRVPGSRALSVTVKGSRALREVFGVEAAAC